MHLQEGAQVWGELLGVAAGNGRIDLVVGHAVGGRDATGNHAVRGELSLRGQLRADAERATALALSQAEGARRQLRRKHEDGACA